MEYEKISQEKLQEVIITNLKEDLIDTIRTVQYYLEFDNIYLHNNDIIDEMSIILGNEFLIGRIASERNLEVSQLIFKYFNGLNPIMVNYNKETLIDNLEVGTLSNGAILKCDVSINEINKKIAKVDLIVRYYMDEIEDVNMLRNCTLIADDDGTVMYPNPFYGEVGQPEIVGDFTLINLLIDRGVYTFKVAIQEMIKKSIERIKLKCNYA